MKKGLSPFISLILVVMISIAGIVLVLRIGRPLLEKTEDFSMFSEAKDMMNQINSAIKEVSYEGNGSSRKLGAKISGGEYRVSSSENSIIYELESKYELFPSGMWKKDGDLVIYTGADVKAYEADVIGDGQTELVLENSRILFAINKTANETSPESLNTKYLIKKLWVKDSDTNITPTDSSIQILNISGSSSGTGYTELLDTGSHLNRGRIKLSLTTDAENYQIIYTLTPKSDFVKVSVGVSGESTSLVQNPTEEYYETYMNTTIKSGSLKLEEGWWNYSFEKCRDITVSSATDDYQYRVIFNTTNFNYSYTNDTGSDIRIVNSSCGEKGYEMHHWIETWNESGDSIVWFRGDNSSTTTYSIYYNYTDAESKSNGTEVFELFDDFNDGVVDTSMWNVNGSPIESGGIIITNDGNYVSSKNSYLYHAYGGRFNLTGNNYAFNNQGIGFNGSGGYAIISAHFTPSRVVMCTKRGIYGTGGPEIANQNEYQKFDMRWKSNSFAGYVDGEHEYTITQSVPNTNLEMVIRGGSDSGNTSADYIFVRKYNSPEPTTTTGSEENYEDMKYFSSGYAISNSTSSNNITKATIWANDTNNMTKSFLDSFNDYSKISDYENVAVENGDLKLNLGKCQNLTISSPISDYQYKVIFNTTNFNYSYSKDDGSDLRIFNSSCNSGGQEMNYWIEDWNESGDSTVWFRSDNSSTTVYSVFYNSLGGAKSNGTETFLFFDDFTSDSLAQTTSGNYIIAYEDFTEINKDTPIEMIKKIYTLEGHQDSQNWAVIMISIQNETTGTAPRIGYRYYSRSGTYYTSISIANHTDSETPYTGTKLIDGKYYLISVVRNSTYYGIMNIYEYGQANPYITTGSSNPYGDVNYSRLILWARNQGDDDYIIYNAAGDYYEISGDYTGAELKERLYWIFIKKYNLSEPTVTIGDQTQATQVYPQSGYSKSSQVFPLNLIQWKIFQASDNVTPDGVNASYKILNSSDDSTLCTISSTQANSGYDISSCASGPIKLYTNLSTTNDSNTPSVHEWNVTWLGQIGNITYELSADGGNNWEQVQKGQEHTFTNSGNSLKTRINLTTFDTAFTPSVENYTINYTFSLASLMHSLNYSLSSNSNVYQEDRWICTEDLTNDFFVAWVFSGDDPLYTNYTKTGNIYNISITSPYDVLLAFSKERCSNVAGRENTIITEDFWNMAFPAFSYESINYIINIILEYTKIDIVNTERCAEGYYDIFVKNEGYSGGKTCIRVSVI